MTDAPAPPHRASLAPVRRSNATLAAYAARCLP